MHFHINRKSHRSLETERTITSLSGDHWIGWEADDIKEMFCGKCKGFGGEEQESCKLSWLEFCKKTA
jgi:hypothetical protein